MPSEKSLWRLADQTARRQHGLITQEQLLAAGLSKQSIRTAIGGGRLVRVQPGVYRTFGSRVSIEQSILAAVLRAPNPSAASHRSGGHLWDLRPDLERVEITIPGDARSYPKHAIVHRSIDLMPHHITRRRGIPVTKPARTLIDLATVLKESEMAEVLDRALVRNLVTQTGVRRMIDELTTNGRQGPATIRRLLDKHPLGGVRPESVIEPVMGRILHTSQVAQQVVYQLEVVINGRRFRIDFAVPHVKLGIEVLGLREHGTRQAVVADALRRRMLTLAGWELLEYTLWEMRRVPTRVAREIESVVARRERELGAVLLDPTGTDGQPPFA